MGDPGDGESRRRPPGGRRRPRHHPPLAALGMPRVAAAGSLEAYGVAFPPTSGWWRSAMASPARSSATSPGPSGVADSWVGVLEVRPAVRVAARLAIPLAQASAAWPVLFSATWVWPTG